MATSDVGHNVFDNMFPKVTSRALAPHADLATRARPEALTLAEALPHIDKVKRIAPVAPAVEEQPVVIPVNPTLHHNIT